MLTNYEFVMRGSGVRILFAAPTLPDTSLKQARERRDRAPAASDANAVPIKCMIGRFVTFRATHDVAFKLQWPL